MFYYVPNFITISSVAFAWKSNKHTLIHWFIHPSMLLLQQHTMFVIDNRKVKKKEFNGNDLFGQNLPSTFL